MVYLCITGAFIFVINQGDLFSDGIALFTARLCPCKAPIQIIPFETARKLLMNLYEIYFRVLLKFVDIYQFWLKSDKHNGHFT
jgi:hypothetical protein